MYYLIKRRADARWTAYDIPESQLAHLKAGYEHKGPYANLLAAIAANSGDDRLAVRQSIGNRIGNREPTR